MASRHIPRWLILAVSGFGFGLAIALSVSVMQPAIGLSPPPTTGVGNSLLPHPSAIAQSSGTTATPRIYTTDTDWAEVYRLIPTLPLENQYIDRETGDVAESNTFVGRLIRYHSIVKNRPVFFRLDWKLTLADYLNAHDWIDPEQYPSANSLDTNPLEGDRQVIASMSIRERNDLVDALLLLLNPSYINNVQATPVYSDRIPPGRTDNATPAPPGSTLIPLPQSGDAQLLAP
jgi:hypothetical protein